MTVLVSLTDIPYIDHPTIVLTAKESVDMPFREFAHMFEDLVV